MTIEQMIRLMAIKKKMKEKNLAVANSFKESFFKVLIDIFLLTGNKSLKMQWIFFFSLSSQVARWWQ